MVAFSTPPMPLPKRKPWWHLTLGTQIVIALFLGVVFGAVAPNWSQHITFGRDIFLNLIKSLVAPLIFSSVVAGIAGGGSMGKVGRMGIKALVYFELATCVALAVGLAAVNLTHPGSGITLPEDTGHSAVAKPMTIIETIVHAFPSSIIDAMAHNDVLQIVVFAVIIGLAAVAIGDEARPVVTLCNAVMKLMFKFTDIIMRFAPIGVFSAIAATVGAHGVGVMSHLGLLVGTLYAALIAFLLILIGASVALRLPTIAFLKGIKEAFVLAFATASSESALPKAMEAMEDLGVPRQTVGFVIPAGYSFNLDGSTLYLAIAGVFAAEASHIPFGLEDQLMMMLFLMVASKGVAAVPRASFVVLMAAIDKYHFNANAATLILGVDALMDMARTSVNVFGNCLASMIVAKWEGEFPEKLSYRP